MMAEFYKFQGTGNDFILFDDRAQSVELSVSQIRFLCDRRFGIGADGVILLRSRSGYDFEMVYYNADGNLSSMCGNGGRCIVSFARLLGIVKDKARFLAADGIHDAEFSKLGSDIVKLKMKDVKEISETDGGWLLDTGSPHLVLAVSDLQLLDVKSEGRSIRNGDKFKTEGVNVNFVEAKPKGLFVRTYERGVEDETLSCGTGVTACALVAIQNNWTENGINESKIFTPGGQLVVHASRLDSGFTDIWLEGPATFVFRGTIAI